MKLPQNVVTGPYQAFPRPISRRKQDAHSCDLQASPHQQTQTCQADGARLRLAICYLRSSIDGSLFVGRTLTSQDCPSQIETLCGQSLHRFGQVSWSSTPYGRIEATPYTYHLGHAKTSKQGQWGEIVPGWGGGEETQFMYFLGSYLG